MKVKEIIQVELARLGKTISSVSVYNVSVNRCSNMKEQIITHYLSEIEDPMANSVLYTRDDVLFLTKTESKTHLNEFLKKDFNIRGNDRDYTYFECFLNSLREMELFKIAFNINSLEEQNKLFQLLNNNYWVPRELMNIGTNDKPFFITVFVPFEVSYKS